MENFMKLLFNPLILLTISLSLNSSNFLLSPPEEIVRDDECSFSTCFTWGDLEKNMYELSFSYENQESAMQLIILEKLANKLDNDKLALFERKEIEIEGSKNTVFVFQKGGSENTFQPLEICQQEHIEYCLTKPLCYNNVVPHMMDWESLLQIITTKNILFYTGAGISASANIWTMGELKKSLLIADLDANPQSAICNVVNNHELLLKRFSEFCKSMYMSKPTAAHNALKDIAISKSTQILTENLDLLHEGTGIKPIRVNAERFKNEVKTEWLNDIDFIICIGLSRDDKGFLGWYLQHNPQGNIIAIDLAQPEYLPENGFWVDGNAQKILPQLNQLLTDNS